MLKKDNDRYKEFVLYFEEMNKVGAPYGTNDMIIKAEELGLPTASREEILGNNWGK